MNRQRVQFWTVTRLIGLSAIIAFSFVTNAVPQSGPPSTNAPSLSETLQWLSGASEVESADGDEHHTFENNGKDCSVTIAESRTAATPGFWHKLSFSLANIDPEDIRVHDLSKGVMPIPGKFAVDFHTTNYTKKIITTSSAVRVAVPTSDYIYFTNDWFAPKFAKALAHAARLCGAKRSSF
jgi:hypothetical protein